MSILSDRDIKFVWNETQDFTPITALRRICKAQGLHSRQEVIKEMDESCTEHGASYVPIMFDQYCKRGKWYYSRKRDCPLCWAKIKQEIRC